MALLFGRNCSFWGGSGDLIRIKYNSDARMQTRGVEHDKVLKKAAAALSRSSQAPRREFDDENVSRDGDEVEQKCWGTT